MSQVEIYTKGLGGVAFVALVALVAACGESSPSDVEDDDQPATAVVTGVVHDSSAVLPPGRTSMAPTDSTDYDGVATGVAQVEIYSDAGGWVSLGEASAVTFDIYCEEAAVVRSAVVVDADTYDMVRLTLTDFELSVLGGAVLEATTYADPFTVAFGSSVVSEQSVDPFTLGEGDSATILFDLNTELWLDDVVVSEGTVADSDVQGATNVFVR